TKQIVFIGDMAQLPPVIKDNTRSVLYRTYNGIRMFDAKIYPSLNVETVDLNEVVRQSDTEFINALNLLREGSQASYFRQFVGNESNGGIVLAPHNSTVEKYNRAGLESLPGDTFTFTAKVEGNLKADDFNLETVVNVKQ